MNALADRLQKSFSRSLQGLQRQGTIWSPKALEESRVKICGARDLPMFDPRVASRLDDALKRLIDVNGQLK